MSRENVEVVEALLDAWNQGDMKALAELYRDDAVVWPPEGWPEPGPFVGREAIIREFSQVRAAFDADAIELVGEMVEVADRVLLRMIWHGTGYGPEANMEWTLVYTLRSGRVLTLEYFWDHAEALEAVGLRE